MVSSQSIGKSAKIDSDLNVLASGLMLNKFSHPNQSSKNNNLLNIHRVVIILDAIF